MFAIGTEVEISFRRGVYGKVVGFQGTRAVLVEFPSQLKGFDGYYAPESLAVVPPMPKCCRCHSDACFESDSGAPFCGECLFG